MSSAEEVAHAVNATDPIERIHRLLLCRAEYKHDTGIEEQARAMRHVFLEELRALLQGGPLPTPQGDDRDLVRHMLRNFLGEIPRDKWEPILIRWLAVCDRDESFFGWFSLFWWG